jgi:hypothetical protein
MPSFTRRDILLSVLAAMAMTALTGAFHNADAQQPASSNPAPKSQGSEDALNAIKVPTLDTRGEGKLAAFAASASASKDGYVVVLVLASNDNTVDIFEIAK